VEIEKMISVLFGCLSSRIINRTKTAALKKVTEAIISLNSEQRTL